MDAIPLPGFCEPLSSLSHLGAAGVAVVAGIALLRSVWGSGHRRVGAYTLFVLSAVVLLATSGTYHAMPFGSSARQLLQRADHAAIFVLIAGSFTPLLYDHFEGPLHAVLQGAVWICAFGGVFLKLFFFDSVPHGIGLAMYLGLGWFGVVVAGLAARRYGVRPLLPMLYGGILYTVGALCDFLHWPLLIEGVFRPHEVFHFFVVAALAVHWRWIAARARQPMVPREHLAVVIPS